MWYNTSTNMSRWMYNYDINCNSDVFQVNPNGLYIALRFSCDFCSTYRVGANRNPWPVLFHGFCCGGLYSRRASIRDRALFFHRFSTACKAQIMACASKNTSMNLQFNQEKASVYCTYVMCKSGNCIGKEPVSSEITRLPGASTYNTYSMPGRLRVPRALFERGFYFLITVNGQPSIWEGLLFECVRYLLVHNCHVIVRESIHRILQLPGHYHSEFCRRLLMIALVINMISSINIFGSC